MIFQPLLFNVKAYQPTDFHFFLDKKTKQTCPTTGGKIKTSEFLFELYEGLFFPHSKPLRFPACLAQTRL
ncbi:MAG: hypothetical protein ACI8SE_000967, partial [Bacteroidia bacterium]